MSLTDYIIKMKDTNECPILKDIFTDLHEMFFPTPYEPSVSKAISISQTQHNLSYPSVVAVKANDKNVLGKNTVIARVENNGYGNIILPSGEILEWIYSTEEDNMQIFMLNNKHIFIQKNKSRFIHIIDTTNYSKYKDIVDFIIEYAKDAYVQLEVNNYEQEN